MLLLSCKQVTGINAVSIHKDGYLLQKTVTRLPKDLGLYGNYIEGFKRAFIALSLYMERNGYDDNVVIECNSEVFVNWLKSGSCPKEFAEKFKEMWVELDKLPVMYTVVKSKKVQAERYAKESELPKYKLESLDI